MPHNSLELIELLIAESVNNQEINNPNSYVEVINRSRPKGFAERFALLLEETPIIHSSLKPEFFLHFFLGSILTLPNTVLISKLNIEDIFLKLDTDKLKTVKLVFKIRDQEHHKLKFITINTGSESGNIWFTAEELSEIKGRHLSVTSDNVIRIEEQILHIVQDNGFRFKILTKTHNQEFITLPLSNSATKTTFVQVKNTGQGRQVSEVLDPLFDKLNSNLLSDVNISTRQIFESLKAIYKSYDAKVLGTSEASYHGYIYGFFRLNYKYKYALDCYVEFFKSKIKE